MELNFTEAHMRNSSIPINNAFEFPLTNKVRTRKTCLGTSLTERALFHLTKEISSKGCHVCYVIILLRDPLILTHISLETL